jgi:hypothetical protein
MSGKGCLRFTLFGCLGLLAIGVLIMGIAALMAWHGLGKRQVEEPELTALAATIPGERLTKGGRIILDLGQGEFRIGVAPPGEGLIVKARLDVSAYSLSDSLEVLPDSSWVYRIDFHRTIPGLQALMRSLIGGGVGSYVHVFLPPDLPVHLEVNAREGGLEAELGGLWLTDAEIQCSRGGFSLDIGEPLHEPLDRLLIRSSMGGLAARGLGNASPRSLRVDCQMGGADVDLRGEWVRDCDVGLSISMGGMSVVVPEEVVARGLPSQGAAPDQELRSGTAEVPTPVLVFSLSQSMGEIEVRRR